MSFPTRQMHVPTIRTERLLLRLPEASDAPAYLAIHEDTALLHRIPLLTPRGDISVAWRNIALMIGHWYLRGYGEWTVVEIVTGEIVGRVGFNHPEGAGGIELGWIIRRDRWQRGLATEAARAALDWGWSATAIEHMQCTIQTNNLASIRIAERLGASVERTKETESGIFLIYKLRRPR
jgi:RimJ/RimL family protein N-acetyltransferase